MSTEHKLQVAILICFAAIAVGAVAYLELDDWMRRRRYRRLRRGGMYGREW